MFSIYIIIIIMNYLFIFVYFFIFTYLFINLLKKNAWGWVVISHFWALFVLHGPRVFLGWKSWKLYKKCTQALGNRRTIRERKCVATLFFLCLSLCVCVCFGGFLSWLYIVGERVFPYCVCTIGLSISFFILYSYVGVAFGGSEILDQFSVAFK